MTRSEFLEKLKEALSDGMDSYTIQGHLNYYRDYIQKCRKATARKKF